MAQADIKVGNRTKVKRPLLIEPGLSVIATQAEVDQTLNWLKRYRDIELLVRDYAKYAEDFQLTAIEGESARRIDQDELFANKTANATIIAESQRQLYKEAKTLAQTLERAMGIILDEEARTAVCCRYLKGYSYKETLLYMKRGDKSATVDRRLKSGIVSVANTLKKWKVFEIDWNF